MLSPDPLPLALYRPPIILAVESRAATRAATGRLIRALGYDVRTARDGRQALRMLRQYPSLHQLVLANIVLPDMDGGQLAERIAAQHLGTRIILVAEYAPIGKAAAVIGAHPDLPVLRKPFGFRELHEELFRQIGPARAALPLTGRSGPSRRRQRTGVR